MSITDADRELRSRLQQVIGAEATETLLTKFGDVGREQNSLDARMQIGFSQLRGEIADLRAELKTDMAELRGDFGDIRAEFGDLRAEFGDLRAEFGGLRGEFGGLRGEVGGLRGEFGELRAEVADRLEQQTRYLLFGMIGSMATIAGIAFGAARLG